MKYTTIATAEMKPDVYGGKNCEEHMPQWIGSFYDEEMDELGTIELDPKSFPAGTKITIEVPECPECNMDADLCQEMGECEFDWHKWADDEYS